jgi:hypothetical protein
MSTVSEREKFDFEQEKWRAETAIRAREVSVKERDEAGAKWRSPLVVAVFAAAVAAGGNAVIAMVNGAQQVALENSKAESTRILEMTKTGNTETAATNLKFLLASGLITDPERVEKVKVFLGNREVGGGPALPAAGGISVFDASGNLSEDINKLLRDYQRHHSSIGLVASRPNMVFKSEGYWPISYYAPPDKIFMDPRMAADLTVLLREYNHHVLRSKLGLAEWTGDLAAIESGVADYLGCSFLDNPRFGAIAVKVTDPKDPYSRDLAKEENYREFKARLADTRAVPDKLFEGAKVWGALFWAMRTTLGSQRSDKIVAAAWRDVKWPNNETDRAPVFVQMLISTAGSMAPEDAEVVRSLLKRRDFPVPGEQNLRQSER